MRARNALAAAVLAVATSGCYWAVRDRGEGRDHGSQRGEHEGSRGHDGERERGDHDGEHHGDRDGDHR